MPKRRRTLQEADMEISKAREYLQETKVKLTDLAQENARLKVLLQKYLEKDDSLLSSSQLSCGESQDTNNDSLHSNSETHAETTDIEFDSSDFSTTDCQDLGASQEFTAEDLSLSQFSDIGSLSQIDDVIDLLDRQDTGETNRLLELEEEVSKLKQPPSHVRVGVGVILTSKDHPNCVLIGRRKGSHGSGKIQLPGGHLEFGETWEDCGVREVEEETGINVQKLIFASVTNDYMKDEEKHYITIFMRGQVEGKQIPKVMEPEKCEGWEWKKLESLKETGTYELLFLPLKHLIDSEYALSD